MHVASHTDPPAALAEYGVLETADGRRFWLRWRGPGIAALTEQTAAGPRPLADRDAAQGLVNAALYVPRARLPAPAEDEYYLSDLVGLAARDAAGAALGRVAAVHDYGAGASLEVHRDGAPPLLVPFTRAAVPEVDLAAGVVVLAPPAVIEAAAP